MQPSEYITQKEVIPVASLAEFMATQEAEPFLQEDNRIIGCIDGRVMPEGVLGLAGSGILLPRDPENNDLPEKKYMENFIQMIRAGELTTLTWHRGHGGCGAAGVYLRSLSVKDPDEIAISEAARRFAENLADELTTQSGIKVNVEEAPAPGGHNEEGVYVDFTNRLDLMPEISKDKRLPYGFTVNPRLTNDFEYAVKEIKISVSIAFGDHGKGADLYTKENPFFIILLDNPGNPMSVADLHKMVEEMINKDYSDIKDRIKIDTVKTTV